MGRKTWESLPSVARPLPGRLNIVLTRNENYKLEYNSDTLDESTPPPQTMSGLEQSLVSLSANPDVAEIFVAGGQPIYEEALQSSLRDSCKLFIKTRLNKDYEADVFFPEVGEGFDPLFISKTFSVAKERQTFDFVFYGNNDLLAEKPELIPTRLMEMYPEHPEM